MKRILWIFVVVGVAGVGTLQAAGVSYSGMLTNTEDGGLFVTGQDWHSPVTSLSWTVGTTATPGVWHYAYTIQVPNNVGQWADIQCVIVEASNGTNGPIFTEADLLSYASTPNGWIQSVEVGAHQPADHVNLPRVLYGIEFCTVDIDPTTLVIEFDTDRAPVWGDFYARSYVVNGHFSALANDGLMGIGPDVDPDPELYPPSDGSIAHHVLVPDSANVPPPVIPAPGAILLGTLGASLTGWLRRRQYL